jgi:hypothetical protein
LKYGENMKYQTDKKIEVQELSGGLYSWCLNEIDVNTGKRGEDLIPWASYLYFMGSSFKVVNNLFSDDCIDPVDGANKACSKFSQVVVGVFHPGVCSDGENLDDVVEYSMFGRDKPITEIDVRITSDGGAESFKLNGSPAYVYELDFSKQYQKDWVEFNINLSKENFDKLVELVDLNKVESATLLLKAVSGFYSEWSPSIKTGFIKILTDKHKIENIGVSQIKPPVLESFEEYGSFELWLGNTKNLNVKPQGKSFNIQEAFKVEYEEEEDEEIPELLIDTLNRSNTDLANKVASILKLPLWIIAASLLVLIFK